MHRGDLLDGPAALVPEHDRVAVGMIRLTRHEKYVIDQAAKAWAAAWPHAAKRSVARDPLGSKKRKHQGATADDILEEHGIGLSYQRTVGRVTVDYCDIVRAVITRGRELTGQPREERVCQHCGRRYRRKRYSLKQFRKSKYCSRDCQRAAWAERTNAA